MGNYPNHPHLGKPCAYCGKPNDGGRMQPGDLPHSNYPLPICKACKAAADAACEARMVAMMKPLAAEFAKLHGGAKPAQTHRLAADIANAPPEKKRGCVVYTGNENGMAVDRKATAEVLGHDEAAICPDCGEVMDAGRCPACEAAKLQEDYADEERKGIR